MLACISLLVLSATALPLDVTGPWTVSVGPGSVTLDGKTVTVAESAVFEIAPPPFIEVRNEIRPNIPLFNPKAGGWVKGARAEKLMAEECSATGALLPDSLVLKPEPEGAPFKRGVDYEMDPFWATFGRLEGGAIGEFQKIFVDYDCTLSRLDSIVADADGKLRLVRGVPAPALALPFNPEPGETVVANIFVPAGCEKLSAENLFPVEKTAPVPVATGKEAEALLPKTLAKLREGGVVTIVAFGDSVTNGGGVGDKKELWYQNVFAARLRERFPKAEVRMRTAAWPGGGSRNYLEAPAGGTYDFQRDVLDPKPDLVTIEFVNDAYLDETTTQPHYAGILEKIQSAGAEVALITPHLVRPDWMKVETLKFDGDPRPYVRGLLRFAAENKVALADASALWCQLHRCGLPYITLLSNAINHPDARGQALFADALMALFPEE